MPVTDDAPLIVFSDDWGRHPSSCQHLVARLLPRRQVVWVNTIGTRPPRLNWSTFRRGFEKLRQWTSTRRSHAPLPASTNPGAAPNPTILNPRMWPSFRSSFARRLNRRLLLRAIEPLANAFPVAPVVVTTLPLTADLVGRFRAARWVYYCVDDFSVWPGLDGQTMRIMEAELVRHVDVAIAVSETLQAHLSALGKSAHLLTHGVDLDFWRTASDDSKQTWELEVQRLEPPLVVFWGVIDRRLDVDFIRTLSESLARGTILFVGPIDGPELTLFRLPRVQFLPTVPYADLPRLASYASTFIAPYADLPVTRAMQPLKLKEYIATDKPVVVRKLPATSSWADCADVVETAASFAAMVAERLARGVPPEQIHARERLATESWDAKSIDFEKWIDGILT